MQFLSLLVLIVSTLFITNLQGVNCVQRNHIDNVIKFLDEKIIQLQATTSEKIGLSTFHKGLYESDFRMNFHGSLQSWFMRNSFHVLANDPFSTMWITILLLEAASVKNAPVPTNQQLNNALEAVSSYYDKNTPDGDGMMVYCIQKKNETANNYYCHPKNVNSFVNATDKFFNIFLNYTTSKEMANMVSNLQLLTQIISGDANVPADFDDIFINIGLGSLLSTYSVTNKPFQLWKDKNFRFARVFAAMKKYAYRPFSIGVPAVVNPVCYFCLREYLQSINNGYPAAFVKTWAYDINEEYSQYMKVPFNVNDIDICIGANVIYAISSLLLTDIADTEEWFDDDVQTIYENTTNLIAWMIQRNFSNRRDLAMPYYASIYFFYWTTSRTYSLLQTYNASNSLPHPVLLTKVVDTLSPALRDVMTTDLLRRAKHKSNHYVYFEDFLGIDDGNGSGEDILFSTAMAINALLNTWMVGGEFVPDVPSSVKKVVQKASLWLALNVNSSTFKPYNGLNPIPLISQQQLPYSYPANLMVYMNGSVAPEGAKISDDLIVGVHSIIPEEEYQAALKMKHFGHYTPQDFHGYNGAGYEFLFISSNPVTYAAAKLALTQYKALLASGQLSDFPEH